MNQKTKYLKVASHEVKGPVDKVVLLYSGGLDTSCMLKWIQDMYHAKVIALTIDIGQQADDLEAIKQKALMLGAVEAIVLDCKDEFASEYLAYGIKANASYEGEYHMSTPLGRPLLAKKAVEIAHKYGASVIAHGCTGKGNDQVRLESGILCCDPSMKVIAPVREWGMGRDEELAYAKLHGIPTSQAKKGVAYSWDDNMWGVTGEGGEIENPSLVPLYEQIQQVCKTPEKALENAELITLDFEAGVPVALNGEKMKLAQLVVKLNALAAPHGVGITTLIEDRMVGLKVRGVYEAPAAHVIITAHYNLEKIVSTQKENELKEWVDKQWAHLCYFAMWYEPAMQHLHSYLDSMNRKVTGKVRLKLYKGVVTVLTVDSPFSLFDVHLATFNKDSAFNQNSSAGFIEIFSLGMKTASKVHSGGLL